MVFFFFIQPNAIASFLLSCFRGVGEDYSFDFFTQPFDMVSKLSLNLCYILLTQLNSIHATQATTHLFHSAYQHDSYNSNTLSLNLHCDEESKERDLFCRLGAAKMSCKLNIFVYNSAR